MFYCGQGGIFIHNRSLSSQLSPQVIPLHDLRAGFKSVILPSEPEPTLPPDAHIALHVALHVSDIPVEKVVIVPQQVERKTVDLDIEEEKYINTSMVADNWKIDPYGVEHARVHAGASGSLLAAMRRHHLVNDFVVREDSFYTNQTCSALLEYFGELYNCCFC